MADDVCDQPIVTRYFGGRARGTCYQLNDDTGSYVVYADEQARRAAVAIVRDQIRRNLYKLSDLEIQK